MQQPIYSIKNLSISNNDHKILNINKFDLHRGAMYLFNGYIGSGKTTLMQIFSKEKSIEKGMLYYEGDDIFSISKSKYSKDIVYLGELNNRPWFGGKGKDFIINKIKTYAKNKNHEEMFNKICNSMKISKTILESKISSLSEGEFRWILLASSIAVDSKVLIIDYLDKYIDYNKKIILNRILKRKTSYDGVTIIASTYNADYFKMSSSVNIKIDRGRITQVRSSSNNKRK